ncbi:DUF4349 domain-containing protein [Nocardia sp. NRRL S-836]|uniref:DUF4349 domain-containing protein n=1 Tax=Nocardia sp. NRRL S-836 TaxID=1519492 RepID=UPI0006C5355F|nr:DUF4349 domain-containing protein [Nocardia sp. NRRL S-836]KOV80930.1 hypothetical protein ADL03_30880 [Nocardia sp. NRRL S-836]
MGRRVLWVGVALLALVATGCGASSDSSSGAAVENAAPQQRAAPQEAQKQDRSGQSNQSAQSVQQQERQLVRTATVDLRSDDVLRAIGQIKAKAQQAGGFAGQENSTKSYGTVTVRVPSNELDGIVRSLETERIGEVTRSEVRSEDVTDQLVDVEARIATQKASVDRLRVLFERAGTTAEIAQVEGELTKRQSELESLQRRSESLKGKVALATLTVQVSTTPIPPPVEEKTGFLGAFAAGWGALVHVLRLVLVGVGGVLPFALVFGAPTVALIYWLRRRKRVTPTVEAEA